MERPAQWLAVAGKQSQRPICCGRSVGASHVQRECADLARLYAVQGKLKRSPGSDTGATHPGSAAVGAVALGYAEQSCYIGLDANSSVGPSAEWISGVSHGISIKYGDRGAAT